MAMIKGYCLLQADLMANVEALLADTQTLLARLQSTESGGADDDTFFALDPRGSMSLRQPSPEPQLDAALPASASSCPEEVATDEVYEFQVRNTTPLSVLSTLPNDALHARSKQEPASVLT